MARTNMLPATVVANKVGSRLAVVPRFETNAYDVEELTTWNDADGRPRSHLDTRREERTHVASGVERVERNIVTLRTPSGREFDFDVRHSSMGIGESAHIVVYSVLGQKFFEVFRDDTLDWAGRPAHSIPRWGMYVPAMLTACGLIAAALIAYGLSQPASIAIAAGVGVGLHMTQLGLRAYILRVQRIKRLLVGRMLGKAVRDGRTVTRD